MFFPEGLLGEITTPMGYNKSDPGNEPFPSGLTMNSAILDTQVYSHDIDVCLLIIIAEVINSEHLLRTGL